MAPARNFLSLAVAVALVICVVTAGLNLIVDPFGVYRVVDISGGNGYKPAKYHRVRLVKAFEVQRIGPRAIVLGTSRSHVGIRMTHPGWDLAAEPRFNLAFDGATTHELYDYLRDAEAARPLQLVVLGLDTWQLGTNPSGIRPDFDPTLLDVPDNPWRHVQSRIAQLRILISVDTTLASIRTLEKQDQAARDWLSPDGQRLGEVFFHRPGDEFTVAGPGAYFRHVDREEIGFKLDMGPLAHPRRGAAEPQADLSSLDYVRKIIAFCRAHQIYLRIFITPAHAHQMEISAAVGEWPKIEAGKRALVRMLADDAALHPGAQEFPLWDFSGYSTVTTEPVPQQGSRNEMTYYWDSSHFKESVGDWVLDRLFGSVEPDHRVPEDFGNILTCDTIDAVLVRIRNDRAAYRSNHPDDVAAIRALVTEVYQQIPPVRRVKIVGAE